MQVMNSYCSLSLHIFPILAFSLSPSTGHPKAEIWRLQSGGAGGAGAVFPISEASAAAAQVGALAVGLVRSLGGRCGGGKVGALRPAGLRGAAAAAARGMAAARALRCVDLPAAGPGAARLRRGERAAGLGLREEGARRLGTQGCASLGGSLSTSVGGHGVPAPGLCPEAGGAATLRARLASLSLSLLGGGSPRAPPALPWRPAAPQPPFR